MHELRVSIPLSPNPRLNHFIFFLFKESGGELQQSPSKGAAALPPLPPLSPKDPFLSMLASITAANPDLVAMPPPSNPEIPPFLDLFDSPKLMATPMQVERSVSYNEHRPRKPPPDLPSLLLHGRIVYIGMQVLEANERKVGKVRFKSINNGSPDVDTKGLNCLLSTKVVKRKKQKEMEPDSNGVQIANRVEDDRYSSELPFFFCLGLGLKTCLCMYMRVHVDLAWMVVGRKGKPGHG